MLPALAGQRVLDDLVHLRREYWVHPDLVVVSGDLAEQARPDEFEWATVCLHMLLRGLELSTRHVLIVPGNHDISRLKCPGVPAQLRGRPG